MGVLTCIGRITVFLVTLSLSLLVAERADAWSSPHGSYGSMPGTCAVCHQTHRAQGYYLLQAASVRALCDSCHQGYQGSDYDVEAGTINNGGANTSSLAGGFSLSGSISSAHLLDTLRSPMDVPGGATATNVALTCTSCHNPHGSTNYRIFRTSVTWNGGSTAVSNFTATVGNRLAAETVTYQTGSLDACSSCHPDYKRRVDGTYSSGFRHKVNVTVSLTTYTPGSLPLEQQSPANRLVCLTCHYAHGTKVSNTANSNRQGYSTNLKRQTDSGVCSGCHFNQ